MFQRTAPERRFRVPLFLAALLAASFSAFPAYGSFHAVNVSEVYTNADGSVQFIELQCLAAGQTQMQNTRVVVWNADSTVSAILFDFTTTISWVANQNMLLATASFQDTAGFAPDFVIPNGIFFPDGRVGLNRDPGVPGAIVVDGVAYGAYTGANTGYGTPAAALPADAFQSLKRIVFGISGRNNSNDWVVAANSPRRLDGTTTTLHNPTGVAEGLPRTALVLAQSRPNPARDEAWIDFSLEKAASVTLQIYGVDGRLLRALPAGRLDPGPHAIRWDGRDTNGRPAAGGVYLYRIIAGDESATRRLTVVR